MLLIYDDNTYRYFLQTWYGDPKRGADPREGVAHQAASPVGTTRPEDHWGIRT